MKNCRRYLNGVRGLLLVAEVKRLKEIIEDRTKEIQYYEQENQRLFQALEKATEENKSLNQELDALLNGSER
jgi:cell division protein FtsB